MVTLTDAMGMMTELYNNNKSVSGNSFSQEQLEGITCIFFDKHGVTLEFLERMKSLTSLEWHNGVEIDIKGRIPITLTELEIHWSTIHDQDALRQMVMLTRVTLRHCRVTDLNIFSNLTELTYVNVSENFEQFDLEPLTRLPKLQTIVLYSNYIVDVGPLERCLTLVEIDLSYTQVAQIIPLLSLPRLRVLQFHSTRVTLIHALQARFLAPAGCTLYPGWNSSIWLLVGQVLAMQCNGPLRRIGTRRRDLYGLLADVLI